MDTRTVAGTAPAWSRWGAPDPERYSVGGGAGASAGRGAAGGFMTALSCLGHLCSVGPLKCRWTTLFREPDDPTARKWSNGT